jgi:hypothetical protein
VGELVVITMTVTNTGGAGATGVTPTLIPTAPLGILGGPVPAGPVSIAGGGSAQTFVWTYTTTGPGTVSFNGSASGLDANSAAGVGTGALTSGSVVVTAAGALAVTSLAISPAPSVNAGDGLTVTLTVRNPGGNPVSLTGVVRTTGNPASFGAASALVPAVPVTVNAGASTVFTWSYVTIAPGSGSVWADVSGTDAVTGLPVPTVTAGSNVVGVAGNAGSVVVTPAAGKALVGSSVSFSAVVLDTSGVPKPGVPVRVTVLAGGGTAVLSSTVTDNAGTVTGTLHLGAEPVQNAIRVDVTAGVTQPSGTGYVDGTAAGSLAAYLNRNYFNPSAGETLRVRMVVPAHVRLSVRIYNVAGELVRTVADADVLPGVTSWEWDGRTAQGGPASNGTYLVQVVAGNDVRIRKVIVFRK